MASFDRPQWDARRDLARGLQDLASRRADSGDHDGAKILREGSAILAYTARREESTTVADDRRNRLAAEGYRDRMNTPPEEPGALSERIAKILADHEWRYLARGVVTHAVGLKHATLRSIAPCGAGPQWASAAYGWMGTGSQDEYERAAALPKCRHCVSIITKTMPVRRTHQLDQQQTRTF